MTHAPSKKLLTQAAIAAVVIGAGTAIYQHQSDEHQSLCAYFTDSIGLYEGNNVTLLGVTVGTVTSLRPQGDRVRADLDIPRDVELPNDVTAVITSDSVVTDRRVELAKAYVAGPRWDTTQCLPLERTATPKSISAAMDAVDQSVSNLLAANSTTSQPETDTALKDLLGGIDRNLAGTTTQLRELISNLSHVAGDPDARDLALRSLLDNLDALSSTFVERLPDLTLFIDNIRALAATVNNWLQGLIPGITAATEMVPILRRNIEKYQGALYLALDQMVPLAHRIQANAADVKDIIALIPAFSQGLQQLYDADAKAARLTVAPPATDPANATAASLCAAVGVRTPTSCDGVGNEHIDIGLARLLLGSVGAL